MSKWSSCPPGRLDKSVSGPAPCQGPRNPPIDVCATREWMVSTPVGHLSPSLFLWILTHTSHSMEGIVLPQQATYRGYNLWEVSDKILESIQQPIQWPDLTHILGWFLLVDSLCLGWCWFVLAIATSDEHTSKYDWHPTLEFSFGQLYGVHPTVIKEKLEFFYQLLHCQQFYSPPLLV